MMSVEILVSGRGCCDAELSGALRFANAPYGRENWLDGGGCYWLLDVVAPTPEHTAAVIGNFRHILSKGAGDLTQTNARLRMHPIVTRLVGADVLERLGKRRSPQ